METFYLVVVVVLFILAISDLVVGVSNDAVNFLNSAIGSKAAPFKIIILIAALGVLFGATFSSGMMEVARKGVFHPDQFYFNEIMIIFLAVMITDVLLLDLFNTFGLPTSTTVSIVFELLGAAVGMALIKIYQSADGLIDMGTYINTGKALAIIFGILMSVVIAFSVGLLVQFFTRTIFSFNYKKSYKFFGALWGGFAVTMIVYFILIKGAKGSSFLTDENVAFIKSNTWQILGVSFIGFTFILQLLVWFSRINILKVIVLAGTFALAMAFAGNDLVNFIGVPLAGFESYKAFIASGVDTPGILTMDILKEPVKTPTLYLLIAGLVMVITLWISRKARSVTATTLDLSRQGEGEERFQSNMFARSIVRITIEAHRIAMLYMPKAIKKFMQRRFDQTVVETVNKKDRLSFDLIRASVNLVVAAVLIAFGTSLKLPLSTTYVTFMVAMGTSLADGAWGRESAVYRISGVVTVIVGWFFTAIIAFMAAFVVANLIYWGGIISIGILIALAIFFIVKTHAIHKKRDDKRKKHELEEFDEKILDKENVFIVCNENVSTLVLASKEIYTHLIGFLLQEKRKPLKKLLKQVDELNAQTKEFNQNSPRVIRKLEENAVEAGHYYVQVIDYLRESMQSLSFLGKPIYKHIDNNHTPPKGYQSESLKELASMVNEYIEDIVNVISAKDFKRNDAVLKKQGAIIDEIAKMKKKQIKILKKESTGTRRSLLYFDILNETRNYLMFLGNLLNALKEFLYFNNGHKLKSEK